MKTIVLTQNKVTTVDDDVYEWASKFKWMAIKCNKKFYAARRLPGERKLLLLHREIMRPAGLLEVDHKKGDGLINLRENLRVATTRQNRQAYQNPKVGKTSNFRGVYFAKKINRWRANITDAGKRIYLGYYNSEIEAAKAYDSAAIQRFGEFASPNFP